MRKQHRNSQKRIYFEDAVYLITTTTYNRFPYFQEKIFCDLFLAIGSEVKLIFSTLECNYDYLNAQARRENLKLCKRIKNFRLYGWVICYEHIHLLLQPGDEFDYSKIMFSIKKQFSQNINTVMGYNNPFTTSPEGAQSIVRLQDHWANEKYDYQDQIQMLNKFDQYIIKFKNQFKQKYSNNNPYPKFRWQKSFHDHYIRNEENFMNCMGYIEYNPIKHSLPNNWSYVYANPEYDDLIDNCQ